MGGDHTLRSLQQDSELTEHVVWLEGIAVALQASWRFHVLTAVIPKDSVGARYK